jgi:hypothetical protein
MPEWVAVSSVKELAAAIPAEQPLGLFGSLAQKAMKKAQEVGAKIKDVAQAAPEKVKAATVGHPATPPTAHSVQSQVKPNDSVWRNLPLEFGPSPHPGTEQVKPQTIQKTAPETVGLSSPSALVQTATPSLPSQQKNDKEQTIAEVTATYQGGHPEFVDKARGLLRLGALGLEFSIKESRTSLRITYDQLRNILEPQKGDFPEEMVNAANLRKTATNAVTGLLGLAARLSRNSTMKAAASVGKTVGNTVKEISKLGPPPKNRLYVIVVIDRVKHKLGFDVVAETTAKMEEAARVFWNCSARVRSQSARTVHSGSARQAMEQIKGLVDQGVLTREQFDKQTTILGQMSELVSDGPERSALCNSFSRGVSQQLLSILKQLKALTDQGIFTESELEQLKAIILPKLQAGKNKKRRARKGHADAMTEEPDDDSISDDSTSEPDEVSSPDDEEAQDFDSDEEAQDFDSDEEAQDFDSDEEAQDFDSDEMPDLVNGDEAFGEETEEDESSVMDEGLEEEAIAEDYSASSECYDE